METQLNEIQENEIYYSYFSEKYLLEDYKYMDEFESWTDELNEYEDELKDKFSYIKNDEERENKICKEIFNYIFQNFPKNDDIIISSFLFYYDDYAHINIDSIVDIFSENIINCSENIKLFLLEFTNEEIEFILYETKLSCIFFVFNNLWEFHNIEKYEIRQKIMLYNILTNLIIYENDLKSVSNYNMNQEELKILSSIKNTITDTETKKQLTFSFLSEIFNYTKINKKENDLDFEIDFSQLKEVSLFYLSDYLKTIVEKIDNNQIEKNKIITENFGFVIFLLDDDKKKSINLKLLDLYGVMF